MATAAWNQAADRRPRGARGWLGILRRTFAEYQSDQIPFVSAGVTFYVLLALFPGLGALAALYGLFADVAQAKKDLQVLAVVLPGDILGFIGDQMIRLSSANGGKLGLAFAGGLLLSVWSANGAVKAMMTALNMALEQTDRRGYLVRTAISLAFTLGFIVVGFAVIAALAAPAAVQPFLGDDAATLVGWIIWPALIVILVVGLALLYRFGPACQDRRLRFFSWGGALAIVGWVALSLAFSTYVANFGHYNATYGSLGAGVGLMVWLYLSTQVVLLGAELNAEIERASQPADPV